jgi:hypothetical protein
LVDEVPEEDEAVICTGGKDTASVRRPFNGIERGGVALEL